MSAAPTKMVVAAGAALMCCGGVQAKSQSPKELSRIRVVASAFGDCVVKRSAPVARAVILGNLENEQIEKSAYRLIDGDCLVKANGGMGARMQFSGDLFRYTMAQALVRMDYPESPNLDFKSVPPLVHLTPNPVPVELLSASGRKAQKAQEDFVKQQQVKALSEFGECVCRHDPLGVHAVLTSPVGSSLEYEAFGKVATPLGACLSGGQVKFGREVLRGLLALNFYRLAGAPTGAPVATLKVVH